jgi:N-acetylglucosamine-6-phosphate deacetylase
MTSAAAYFDLQVNGYGGVDFNGDDLTADALHTACQRLRNDGVGASLATVITDHLPLMCRRLARLVELRERDPLAADVIVGLHVEGPFINPKRGYVGAHPPDAVVPGDADAALRLLDAGAGLVRILTLAPECDPQQIVTRTVSRRGVVVSAGHTDADRDVLNAAVDAGLSMFTHLGNGCPAELPRHNNIIQRVLAIADRVRIGFIADGVHVPMFALKNYLRLAGAENSFVVSDAMSAAGLGPGVYRLGRNEVKVGEDCAARSPDGSHLMGSAVTMARSAALLGQAGFTADEVHRLTFDNPRRAVGLA